MKAKVVPLTPSRWADLEAVFNARGCSVARGCWCMFYRRTGPLPTGESGVRGSRAAFRKLVNSRRPPGLLAYQGKQPVGWVSLAPREEYAKLERSPVMKPVDDKPVWSIVCFVVPSEYRGQGVAQALLEGAVAYAKKRRAKLLEGYPVDKPTRSTDDFMWFGAKAMFDRAGFREVARRKPFRPVVRIKL